MALQRGVYRPRDAEHAVLHQVIAEHLEAFLRAVAEAGDGSGLPQFVEREFREFLTCGVFEHDVARFRCEGCAREHLVPFSCKGRAWCPSCGGRRMTERAAHLVGRGAAVGAGAAVGPDGAVSAPVPDGVESRAEPRGAAEAADLHCGSGFWAAVAAAFWAASVRVWHITSRGWDPWTERPLPEVVRVAYPPSGGRSRPTDPGCAWR
jgi:transposase-like zinc-binding protein